MDKEFKKITERIDTDFSVYSLDNPIDEVIEQLQQIKEKFEGFGYKNLELELEYNWNDNYELIITGTRAETERERLQRLEVIEATKIDKRLQKEAKIEAEKVEYKRLKEKYG